MDFFLRFVECFFCSVSFSFSTTIEPGSSGQVKKEKQNNRYFKKV